VHRGDPRPCLPGEDGRCRAVRQGTPERPPAAPGRPLPGDHGVNVAPTRETLRKDRNARTAFAGRPNRRGRGMGRRSPAPTHCAKRETHLGAVAEGAFPWCGRAFSGGWVPAVVQRAINEAFATVVASRSAAWVSMRIGASLLRCQTRIFQRPLSH
jgi:hypothetical protein